ncbi:MAG: flagellar hook-length control protein FliK [Betaproteobacteria bacterium]|nr:flagellar hook-length control protein FliK [Betaproteobacteria bacterium]
MIPPDVANALRLQIPDQAKVAAQQPQNQPVAAVQQITDVLSNLVPGQRILAEIQALLPNGSYRAVVGQRDITLSLPFSAKPGDTLELEVTESDGKLTLAFVTNRSDSAAAKAPPESASTSLSTAGKLIGDLMGNIQTDGKRAPAAPLNNAQPLVETMPKTAADLVPVLKQALTESGMFYEAHQARWVAGEFPTENLKQEPQGKLSSAQTNATVNPENTPKTNNLPNAEPASNTAPTTASRAEPSAGTAVPRDLMPIVQQQLDGLATQNFAWQGQVWPGQQMRWEIGENQDDSRSSSSDEIQRWQTRLKLSLPQLGDIDITLNLKAGGEVRVAVTAGTESSETRLRDEVQQLRKQFEAAGLNLTEVSVQHDEAAD